MSQTQTSMNPSMPLRLATDKAVLRITLAMPARRNPLSEAMIDALSEAISAAADDPGVHVIVIDAEGPVFSAGHDLRELTQERTGADGGRAYFHEIIGKCASMMQKIMQCPKPVIAQVNGPATAAGCQLVASCDLAICTPESRFITPGVNIGLFCSTPMVALTRNVPRKQAMEMLLTGEAMDAEQALQYGLVNRVVPADELAAATMEMALTIASKSPATIRIGKEAFYRQAEMGVEEAYRYTAHVMAENMLHADAKEGIGAFIEKREPIWQKDQS